MKKSTLIVFILIVIAFTTNVDENVSTARKITKEFGSQLKSELMKGMKAGGAEKAIEVCYVQAPEIAKQISDTTGWTVSRTSLKIRNKSNAPDEWELENLKKFEQLLNEGMEISILEVADTVNLGGEKYFRYMKAIETGSVCLNCHGSKIKEPIQENITKLYNEDKAVDYKMGEIRGAFSLSKKIN